MSNSLATLNDITEGLYEVTIRHGLSSKRWADAKNLAKRMPQAEFDADRKVWTVAVVPGRNGLDGQSALHTLITAYECPVERLSDDSAADVERAALEAERDRLESRIAEIDKRLAQLA